MGQCLINLDDVLVNSCDVLEVAGIAHSRQLRLLLIRTQTGEIIFLLLIETLQIALCVVGDRGLSEKFLQQRRRALDGIVTFIAAARTWIDNQFVGAERFLVEEDFWTKALAVVQV